MVLRTPVLVMGLLALAAGAQAREFTYQCEDRTELVANFTPDRVHLTRGGKQYTLARVRAAGAARYTHRKAGLELIAQKKDVVLIDHDNEIRCAFTVQP
jgi:Membrane-bound lysozyme-inhibitor of c-type lysozyme